MTAWDEYAAAVNELDHVRRQAAAAVASADRVAQTARNDAAGLKRRISLQRARIVELSGRTGRGRPDVDPLPEDRAASATLIPNSVMDPTPGVSAALKGAWAALDAADAELASGPDAALRSGLLTAWPPAARNALPYGWYAFLAILALVFIHALAGPSPGAGVVTLGFDFAVPFVAFLLGFGSIGLLYGPDRRGSKRRSVPLGLLICAVPLVIGLALSVA